MRKFSTIVLILVALVSVSACQSDSPRKNESAGTAIGAIVGAGVGAAFGSGSGKAAAVAAGFIVGAFIGNRIGASMDRNDQRNMQDAFDNNDNGETKSWSNSRTGNSYSVTTHNRYVANNQTCRKYTTRAVINGNRRALNGTACRQSNGAWDAEVA